MSFDPASPDYWTDPNNADYSDKENFNKLKNGGSFTLGNIPAQCFLASDPFDMSDDKLSTYGTDGGKGGLPGSSFLNTAKGGDVAGGGAGSRCTVDNEKDARKLCHAFGVGCAGYQTTADGKFQLRATLANDTGYKYWCSSKEAAFNCKPKGTPPTYKIKSQKYWSAVQPATMDNYTLIPKYKGTDAGGPPVTLGNIPGGGNCGGDQKADLCTITQQLTPEEAVKNCNLLGSGCAGFQLNGGKANLLGTMSNTHQTTGKDNPAIKEAETAGKIIQQNSLDGKSRANGIIDVPAWKAYATSGYNGKATDATNMITFGVGANTLQDSCKYPNGRPSDGYMVQYWCSSAYSGFVCGESTADLYLKCLASITKIPTIRNNILQQVEIKDLVVGDIIKTTRGNFPLSHIMKSDTKGRKHTYVKIAKDSLGINLPSEDLYVTHEHSFSLGYYKNKFLNRNIHDEEQDDMVYLHITADELADKVPGISRVDRTFDAAINLVFDEHVSIDIYGLDVMAHHPKGNPYILPQEKYQDQSKFNNKKQKPLFVKHATLEKLKPAHMSISEFVGQCLTSNNDIKATLKDLSNPSFTPPKTVYKTRNFSQISVN